jgi:hypothetical protein
MIGSKLLDSKNDVSGMLLWKGEEDLQIATEEQMEIVVDGLGEEDKVDNFESSSSVGKEGAFIAPSTAISTEQSK